MVVRTGIKWAHSSLQTFAVRNDETAYAERQPLFPGVLGYLGGYETIADTMTNPDYRKRPLP